jgi:hypothetical protein
MKILLLFISISSAGWFKNTCTSFFDKIVVDDPYQFEPLWTANLLDYYQELGAKAYFGRLSVDEGRMMNIAGGELRWRIRMGFEGPESTQRITEVLEGYSMFEGDAKHAKAKIKPAPP